MFKIKYVSYFIEGEKEFSLKDGKPNLQSENNDSELASCYTTTVLELSASDEELTYIYNYFRGIPSRMCKEQVVWTGVYAQFIYDNL